MGKRKTPKPEHTPIESIRHKDRRANIPTEELRDFVAEDEETPSTMLYPRDSSLDPQLVWKGKDEQDREDLAVPVVPIYIQERIHPQVLIENLRDTARHGEPEPELTLFDDFNGIGFEDLIEFYRHDQNWSNRMVLGDSLLVMTSLAEKEGLKGKVQMVYLDPPYGIKFGSNWQVSTRKRDVKDGSEADVTRQPEQVKAFRDTWELGIHSYLSYLRDRFTVARELLTETGSIFVQIGDENVHHVRCVLDEVFGSGNCLGLITVKKTGGLGTAGLKGVCDYVLWYARRGESAKYRQLLQTKEVGVGASTGERYDQVDLGDGSRRAMSADERGDPSLVPSGARAFQHTALISPAYRRNTTVSYAYAGATYHPGQDSCWKTTVEGLDRLARSGRIARGGRTIRYVRYLDDYPAYELTNLWDDIGSASDKIYVVQSGTRLIERCLLMSTDPGDLVLDPTCVRAGTRVLVGRAPHPSSPASGGGELAPSPFTGRAGVGDPLAGKPGEGEPAAVPIESLRSGDHVLGHDGLPHRVLRVIAREYRGQMVSLRHDGCPHALCCTADHRILAKLRPRTLGGARDWSGSPPASLERRREMRTEPTPAEALLWQRLRNQQQGPKFRRQHPIGPYIADFYSREAHLVVEVDGGSHADPHAAEHDRERDAHMRSLGLDVLRFTNAQVETDLEGVCAAVRSQCAIRADSQSGVEWVQAGALLPGDLVFYGERREPAELREVRSEYVEEPVYDLEVEGAHSFLTEVCVVHNCGSGTTAFVAEQWGRRWITCDTSRVALALARTRIMGAKYPYYVLSDEQGGLAPRVPDVRRGFVYRRVPHITLKAIANNAEIDEIHEHWQATLEPLRAAINETAGTTWEEWEIPRPEDAQSLPTEARERIERWWEFRRARQRAIDDSISRNADYEVLYDQPEEDKKRIRVAGPFTVESLSPHRVLDAEQDLPGSETDGHRDAATDQFEALVLANLRAAGVQNTVRQERIAFDALDAHAGRWIQAIGHYTDSAGGNRRAAIAIGPEHGTVGPQLVKEAAKEAVQGVGFDVLVVCGFAFDPHVSEETKRYGSLTILAARMNPDLAMSELLKKTGAGNLFMVFGEPDVEVTRTDDGRVVVRVRGVDVYDPTTGAIRSSSTDDIACWFADTNYDGESFFVRHACFTGGNEPYEKLQRALRSEISEDAWASLYSTVSRPFDPPESGRIAVKVINHYGDEVLKVYEVAP